MCGVSSIPTRGSQVFSLINFRRTLRGNLSNYSRQEVNSSSRRQNLGVASRLRAQSEKSYELTAMVAKRGWHVNCKESNLRTRKFRACRDPLPFPLSKIGCYLVKVSGNIASARPRAERKFRADRPVCNVQVATSLLPSQVV